MEKTKQCSQCKRTKFLREFGQEERAADGLRYSCLECDRERRRKYHLANKEARNANARARRKENPNRDREYGLRYRDKFVWRRILQHAKKRAAKRGWEFDLEDHLEEFKAKVEPMKCEMTGVQLCSGIGAGSGGKRFWNTASLDRINPSKGYTINNVRVVCWAMNCAMGTWGEEILSNLMSQWMERTE